MLKATLVQQLRARQYPLGDKRWREAVNTATNDEIIVRYIAISDWGRTIIRGGLLDTIIRESVDVDHFLNVCGFITRASDAVRAG